MKKNCWTLYYIFYESFVNEIYSSIIFTVNKKFIDIFSLFTGKLSVKRDAKRADHITRHLVCTILCHVADTS